MNKPAEPNSFRTGPDEQGMFGMFGGRFVAETLMPLILDLQTHWDFAKNDPDVPRRTGRGSTRIISAGPRRCISPSA